MNCDVCREKLSGIEHLKQHIVSDTHQEHLVNSHYGTTRDNSLRSTTSWRRPNATLFSCKPCVMTFQDCSNAVQHLETEEHIILTLATIADFCERVSEDSNDSFPPLFYCVLCNHHSFELDDQHVESIIHEKMAQLMRNLFKKEANTVNCCSDYKISTAPRSLLHYCNLCDVRCRSSRDYEYHLMSGEHKRFEQFINKLIKMKQKYSTDDCSKDAPYLLPVPHNRSIGSHSSEKFDQKERKYCERREKFSDGEPKTKCRSNGEFNDNARNGFNVSFPRLLYCELCNTSFKESKCYMQHLASKNHKKVEQFILRIKSESEKKTVCAESDTKNTFREESEKINTVCVESEKKNNFCEVSEKKNIVRVESEKKAAVWEESEKKNIICVKSEKKSMVGVELEKNNFCEESENNSARVEQELKHAILRCEDNYLFCQPRYDKLSTKEYNTLDQQVNRELYQRNDGFLNMAPDKINKDKLDSGTVPQSSQKFEDLISTSHFCELCNIWFNESKSCVRHLKGEMHQRVEQFMTKIFEFIRKNIIYINFDVQIVETYRSIFPPLHYCELCHVWYSDFKHNLHIKGRYHKQRMIQLIDGIVNKEC